MNNIEIKNVSKRYGDITALDDISLSFDQGKIYGLLGRNGAGKTTLLNIITGRIFPDNGVVTVDGDTALENDKALGKLFMMSEITCYPESMRVGEALKWSAEFYPGFSMEYANELAVRFKLNLRKKVKSLSTGYKSIFKLIIALSVNAPYVLLDEPVLGLDANHRDLFYRILLQKYNESPGTYILSTHLVEEVSTIIEDVVIIKDGRIIYNDSCQKLLAGGYTVSGTAAVVDEYTEGRNVVGADSLGGLKSAYVLGTPENVPGGLEISRMDLQKLFVQLTND